MELVVRNISSQIQKVEGGPTQVRWNIEPDISRLKWETVTFISLHASERKLKQLPSLVMQMNEILVFNIG